MAESLKSHKRPNGWTPIIKLLIVCLLTGILTNTVSAQTVTARKVSVESQNKLYQDLAIEAAAAERHYSLLKRLIKAVRPGVAHIEARKEQKSSPTSRRDEARRPVMIEEAGSGVVVEYGRRFYVITNFHVIENCRPGDVRIEIDGRLHYPNRLIHDRETDISVIELGSTDLVAARIGDSKGLEIGDFVVAVGSPFGLSHSVSYGIVSALGRHDLELGPQGVRYQNFIQTDAAINPGNSGGPLINLRGEVIGINTAIASNSGGNDGIGFSIPINMVMRITEDLINYGQVNRGFLGVSLDSRYSFEKAKALGLDYANGALVSNITPGSPAVRAGLQTGDVILELAGEPVIDDSQLVTVVSLLPIDSVVDIKLFRAGVIQSTRITIGNRKALNSRE